MMALNNYLYEMQAKMANSINDVEYIIGSMDSRGFFNGRTFATLDDIVIFWTEWVEDPQHPDVEKFINSLKKLKPGEYIRFKDDCRVENIILRLANKPADNIVMK